MRPRPLRVHTLSCARTAPTLVAVMLLVMAVFPALSHAQNFTIIALPDTQYYSQDYPATFTAQTQWIVNNETSLNIKAVVGLGDVVNGGGVGSEWTAADNAISVLEGQVPYFVTIGNHDYNKNDPQNRTTSATNFNNHFGPARYANAYSGYGGSYTSGSNENFWGSVLINGKQYIFIMLEFYPRMTVLQWAAGVIRAHPAAEVILVTHGYQYNDSNHVALCAQYNAEYYNMGADNDGDEMWVNLASQFPNVSTVLSGHIINGSNPSSAHQTEPGFSGNIVNEVMSDYQNLANGGNGYLRIMTFQPANNQIVVQTYSPTLNAYLTDSANSFTIPWHQTTSTGTGTISGRLKNTGCTAIAGASVSYSGGSTTTDSSGKFTLSNVPAGVQAVTVQASGYPAIVKQVPVAPARTSNPLFFVSTSTGTVSGTLTNADTGTAIPGATVSSSGASTQTDSSGNYTLSGVAAVSAQLTATASGYSNLTQQISVTSGATSALNFKMISTGAPTTGSIVGTITNASTGATISGASIQYSNGTDFSDANGTYGLYGVPKGTVSLTVSANGMQSTAASVAVSGGSTTTKNFALSPIPTGSVAGSVLDSFTNFPIPGAVVSYSGGNTTTDAGGNFTLSGIPTGTQTITASATNYQSSSKNLSITQGGTGRTNFSLNAAAVGTLSGTVTDASTGAPILGASLTYQGGNTLTNASGVYSLVSAPSGTSTLAVSAGGYISKNLSATVSTNQTTTLNVQLTPVPTYGNISGTITDSNTHLALAGASVSAAGITALTANNGTFTLTSVPSGSQTLIVDLDGYQEATQAVSVTANKTTSASVALVPTTGTISGAVVDAASKAIAGATVAYSGGAATTDAQGQYTLENVPPGSIAVTATMSGYIAASGTVTVIAGGTASQNFTLTSATGSLSGQVTDSVTGAGLPGATIAYAGGSASTNNQGQYSIANLAPGTIALTVTLSGYNSAQANATIVAGSAATQNISLVALPTTGTIGGQVTDGITGFGLAGVNISWAGGSTSTDASGNYSLQNVTPGPQTVSASFPAYQAGSQTVTVKAGNAATANFALVLLPTTGTVTGIVSDSATQLPIAGASVSYGNATAMTDATGSYTLANVSAGVQSFDVSAPNYNPGSGLTVTVVAGGTVTQNFSLDPSHQSGGTGNPGSVSGTVIDSASSAPISGVTVSTPNGSTVTDDSGSYSIAGVTAGNVTISASASGYVVYTGTVTVTAGANTEDDLSLTSLANTGTVTGVATDANTGSSLAGVNVTFSGGSATADDSGNFTLSNVPAGNQSLLASLSGYSDQSFSVVVIAQQSVTQNVSLTAVPTTGSIVGVVTDNTSGSPVGNATVSYNGGAVSTSGDGSYSLSNIPAGSVALTVAADGYQNSAANVSVVAGQTATNNFALTLTPITGSVSGHVIDSASGNPLAGATVAYAGGSTTTDSTGSYSLANLTPGTQTLTVTLLGYNPGGNTVSIVAGSNATQDFALVALPTTGTATGTVTDSSTHAGLAGVTIAVGNLSTTSDASGAYTLSNLPTGSQSLTATLAGYNSSTLASVINAGQATTTNFVLAPIVTTGTITGMVTDAATSNAIAGATVSYNGGSTTTDTSGNYEFANVAAGSVTVNVSASGYGNASNSVTVAAGSSATQNFPLTATPKVGSISGKVADVSGRALSAAAVAYSGGSAITDANGNYSLTNVAAGSQTLTASLAGYVSVSQSVSVTTNQSTTQNFTLTLATGTISGTVTNSATNAALPGVTVSYAGGSAITSASGAYTLANVAPGSWTLTFALSGYGSSSQTVTVVAGQTAAANASLTATPGAITGKITNASGGAAIAGATVSYAGGSTTTDSTGTYTLSNVAPGSQSVTVQAAGFTSKTQSVTVNAGSTATLNVALTATTATLTGKITNASSGSGLSGATVSVAGKTATSNSSGVYSVTGVATGTYTMTVTLKGWTNGTASINAVGGTTVTTNIPLATTGIVTGTVKKASGSLDSGVTVTLTGGVIPTTTTVTTNSSGVYKTGWIPVGAYTVTISQSGHTTKSATTSVSTGKTTTLNFTGF